MKKKFAVGDVVKCTTNFSIYKIVEIIKEEFHTHETIYTVDNIRYDWLKPNVQIGDLRTQWFYAVCVANLKTNRIVNGKARTTLTDWCCVLYTKYVEEEKKKLDDILKSLGLAL
jgi:hypothetical protein